MSRNKVQDGDVLEWVATGARVSGAVETVGRLVGVHEKTVVSGEVAQLNTRGVFNVAKVAADTVATIGVRLYHNVSLAQLTTTASTHILAGYSASVDVAGGATTIWVKLIGGMP